MIFNDWYFKVKEALRIVEYIFITYLDNKKTTERDLSIVYEQISQTLLAVVAFVSIPDHTSVVLKLR